MESSADTVQSAAAYLFDIFKATQSVGQSEARNLKNTFGPYPASHATKACQTVNKIVSWLPDKVGLGVLLLSWYTITSTTTTTVLVLEEFMLLEIEYDWVDLDIDWSQSLETHVHVHVYIQLYTMYNDVYSFSLPSSDYTTVKKKYSQFTK